MDKSDEQAPDRNLPARTPLPLPARQIGRSLYTYGAQQRPEGKAYWIIIYRRRYLIAGVLLASLLVSIVSILRTKRMYTATTTILVEPGTPQILDVKELESGAAPGTYEHDYYETEYDILKSRGLAAQVIHQLGLMNDDIFMEGERHLAIASSVRPALTVASHLPIATGPVQAPIAQSEVPPQLVNKYLRGLVIKPQIGTRLISVSYTAPNPALAAGIANAHVQAYITRGMELHSEASREAEAFLEKKVIELKAEVEKSEATLDAYRREHGIVSSTMGDQGSQVILQRLTELNADLNKCEETKIYLESEHQQIQHGNYESLPEVIRSPLIQTLKEEVAKLAAQYANMRNRFNPGYHPLDDLKAQLDDSESRLQEETRVVIDGVESNYKIQVARAEMLHEQIDTTAGQAIARNDAALHDAVLVRQVESDRGLYQDVLRRRAEIGVTANRPSSNVSILDTADPPASPSSPNISVDLAKGVLGGLLGGLGLCFLLEYFDDSLKSRAEVEQYLGIPTLGQVPDFANLPRLGQVSRSRLGWDAANRRPVSGPGQPLPFAEAFRVIRNSILFGRPGISPKTVLVTSAISGEGKTVTAINTAVAFAQLTGRTLLIDADLRRPRCHATLQLKNDAGLSERLLGQKQTREVIQSTQIPGLSVISAGSEVANPGELLASPRMRELLASLVQEYDYIVVDSAPLVPVSDTEGLSTLVDAAIVVASSTSPKQVVYGACSRLELVGAKLFGVVLNRAESSIEHYTYSYHRPGSYEKDAQIS